MKKGLLLIAVGVLTLTTFVAKRSLARESAQNCSYTGNLSDYCYTSDGSNNIRVLACAPGSSDCEY